MGIAAPYVIVPLVFVAFWVVGKHLFLGIENPFLRFKVYFPYGKD